MNGSLRELVKSKYGFFSKAEISRLLEILNASSYAFTNSFEDKGIYVTVTRTKDLGFNDAALFRALSLMGWHAHIVNDYGQSFLMRLIPLTTSLTTVDKSEVMLKILEGAK